MGSDRMLPGTGSLLAIGAGLALLGSGPAAMAGEGKVSVEDCLDTVLDQLGGEAWHLEYESRGGVPIYEFVLHTDQENYYVACDARTGTLAEVDVIVEEDDARWQAAAKIDEDTATQTALDRYKGEVEEIKRLLLSSGGVAYEVDIEIPNANGEFNVYVDAVTGAISQVNHEYWEIGQPAPRLENG